MALVWLETLFKKYLIPTYKWLKATAINKESGKSVVISGSNSNNFFGSVNIEKMVNIKLELSVDKEDPDFDRKISDEIAKNLIKGVSSHDGYGMIFGDVVQIIKSTQLTTQQLNSIRIFRKCEWTEDIIISLKIAYKIYNLEERGQFEQAQSIMSDAFNGKFAFQVRKLYNLVRGDYMESFALSASMSPIQYGKEWIKEILNYFPYAIFIDASATKSNLIDELLLRERNDVRRITLFARGMKIQTLVEGYWEYLYEKKISSEKIPNLPFKIYISTDNSDYKIAWSSAKKVTSELKILKEVPSELLDEWENPQ
jgi:hypothetical protein